MTPTDTASRPTPNTRLRGAWAKSLGEDFVDQYTTPAGATVTLVRFHDGVVQDLGYFECDGCGYVSSRELSESALAPYEQVVPDAEAHATQCAKAKPCRVCAK